VRTAVAGEARYLMCEIQGVREKEDEPFKVMSPFFFFFITLEPRVIHKSMSLKYEPSSEPLHISSKELFSRCARSRGCARKRRSPSRSPHPSPPRTPIRLRAFA